jgi:transcriptional regulator with XRE-family HTH domain
MVRQIRYRFGWSRAEMARSMNCGVEQVLAWESGRTEPSAAARAQLTLFFAQVEANSQRVQRIPIAELIMETTGLDQIHDSQVDRMTKPR